MQDTEVDEELKQIEPLLTDRSIFEGDIRQYLEENDRKAAAHLIKQIIGRMDEFQKKWPGATIPELFLALRDSISIDECLTAISDPHLQRSYSDQVSNPAKFNEIQEIPSNTADFEKIVDEETNSDSDSSDFSDPGDEIGESHRGRPRRGRSGGKGHNRNQISPSTKPHLKLMISRSKRGRGRSRGRGRIANDGEDSFLDFEIPEKKVPRRRGRPSKANSLRNKLTSAIKVEFLKRKALCSDLWDENLPKDSPNSKGIEHQWIRKGHTYVRIGPDSEHANQCMALNPIPGYIDQITKTIMIEPLVDKYGYVLDKLTWHHWYYKRSETLGEGIHTHPFTGVEIKSIRDLELKPLTHENIEYYRNGIDGYPTILGEEEMMPPGT